MPMHAASAALSPVSLDERLILPANAGRTVARQALAQMQRAIIFVACLGAIVSLPFLGKSEPGQDRMARTDHTAPFGALTPVVAMPEKTVTGRQIAQLR